MDRAIKDCGSIAGLGSQDNMHVDRWGGWEQTVARAQGRGAQERRVRNGACWLGYSRVPQRPAPIRDSCYLRDVQTLVCY